MKTLRRHSWRWLLLATVSSLVAAGTWQMYSRPHPVITRGMCEQIREGMTEADVAALIGSPAGNYATRPTFYWQHDLIGQASEDAAKKRDEADRSATYWRTWSDNAGSIAVFFNQKNGQAKRWYFASMASQPPSSLERQVRIFFKRLGITI